MKDGLCSPVILKSNLCGGLGENTRGNEKHSVPEISPNGLTLPSGECGGVQRGLLLLTDLTWLLWKIKM